MTGELPDPGAFGAAFEDIMHAMRQAATRPQSPLAHRLREHLGADPSELPSTVAELATTDHPNLQLALDAVLPDAEIVGYRTQPADGAAPGTPFGPTFGPMVHAIGAAGLPLPPEFELSG
jgi:hypothetical protein